MMDCFDPQKSDLDLLIVINDVISDEVKRQYMDMVLRLYEAAPAKGIELSIVKRSVCKPFVYPTPFDLHFSIAHLDWYKNSPDDYVQKMNGTDKDLAAHFMVMKNRGRVLFGQRIDDVFGEISKQDYIASIWFDIEKAKDDFLQNTMYTTLNLARVLAYQKENLILSKKEGGEWGIANLPEKHRSLLVLVLEEYTEAITAKYDVDLISDYATYMLAEIQNKTT